MCTCSGKVASHSSDREDMGDAHIMVVRHRGQVIDCQSVGLHQDEIVQLSIFNRDFAPQSVDRP